MIIEYETSKFVKETKTIEIEDTKNVFLKGTNPYDGLSTYFGIWRNEEYLVIVTLISGRTISYEYSRSKSIFTEADIRKYLEHNKNVQMISKDAFIAELNKFKQIIKI